MQKIFTKKLTITVSIFMFLLLVIGFFLVKNYNISTFNLTAELKIDQISQLLTQNTVEINTLRESSYEDFLTRTEAVAYIVENNPDVDDAELIHIAELMQIDEIHIFDENGVIVLGTVPEYIGVGVDDGEQIGYFKQILDDPSLKLVQEILPATADSTLKQYIGIGRKDKPGIVQIGMLPKRMFEVLERTELSHVLSSITSEQGEAVYIIDKQTGDIFGNGKANSEQIYNFYDMAKSQAIMDSLKTEEFHKGKYDENYVVLSNTETEIICVVQAENEVLEHIPFYMLTIFLVLLSVTSMMIFSINLLLKKHVVSGLKSIISVLNTITSGNLSTVVKESSNPEFEELSTQINKMVGSLVHSTANTSKIINSVNVEVGIYEYRDDLDIVSTTDKLASILGLSGDETALLYNNKDLFREKIDSILANKCAFEDDFVYQVNDAAGTRYIKIDSYSDESTLLGIAIDTTKDYLRHKNILRERDYDEMSGIYNRRAFARESEKIFDNKDVIKTACLLMIDMDNLKHINDNYGHKFGDNYIKACANVLANFSSKEQCVVSRLSGDEFAVLWHGYNSEDEIITLINKLEQDIKNAYITVPENVKFPVKISAGYIFYPEYKEDQRTLLHFADVAMYQAKQMGKGIYVRYTSDKK